MGSVSVRVSLNLGRARADAADGEADAVELPGYVV